MVWVRSGPGRDAHRAGLSAAAGSLFRAAAGAALDFALPRACVSCERLLPAGETGVVCRLCWSRLAVLPDPVCVRCGHPCLESGCRWCDLLPPYVRAVRSVCWVPAEPASRIIHALKYGGWHSVAGEISARMARLAWPIDVIAERAALVPVPLAGARQRERGYNQSALLASALSMHWGIPAWNECLRRIRDTRTQTELTPDQRHANVDGSVRFHPQKEIALSGAHIVLVDDVITTAATLNECARALYESGARIISYVTFGRARSAGDRN
jgi:ComF family protein